VRKIVESRGGTAGEGNPGVLAASGLVAGEGLAGVAIAGLVASGMVAKDVAPRLAGSVGQVAAGAAILATLWFLGIAGKRR